MRAQTIFDEARFLFQTINRYAPPIIPPNIATMNEMRAVLFANVPVKSAASAVPAIESKKDSKIQLHGKAECQVTVRQFLEKRIGWPEFKLQRLSEPWCKFCRLFISGM